VLRSPAVRLALLLTALGLAACGSDAEQAKTPEPAKTARADSSGQAALALTDGRLGDAVSASDADADEEILGEGGQIPAEVAQAPAGDTGVGGVSGCSDTQLDITPGTLQRVSRATFCLMNAERRKRGLPALKQEGRLAAASVGHSKDMVVKRYFAHASPSGPKLVARLRAAGYIPRVGRWVVGENLAWGAGLIARPKAIVAGWIASPAHRRNLLSPSFSSVGMGVVLGSPTGVAGGVTFTTDFGRLG